MSRTVPNAQPRAGVRTASEVHGTEPGRGRFHWDPITRKALNMAQDKAATLYRMVLPDHTCPFGVRAKELLEEHGYQVEEHILGSREEVDAFKAEHGLTTTPLVFIGDAQIGGSSDLERYLQAG